MLTAKEISVRYAGKVAVDRVSFSLHAGEWLMLIGPNGAGKSSLLSAVGQCTPYEGSIMLNGKDARTWKPKAFARRVGMLAQLNRSEYDFTVEDIVALGRYAHANGFWTGERKADARCIRDALLQTGLSDLRTRSIRTLSGGERQRTFLAQVLAQDPDILLLDEPANHLDPAYQEELFSLIRKWLCGGKRSVISVVHDLSTVLAHANRVLLLHEGKKLLEGSPERILGSEEMNAAYGMDVARHMRSLFEKWKKVKPDAQ